MDDHSVGALFSAAKQGRVEELATLLDDHPELVHARSDPAHHHTLLILAAWHGRTAVAELLLDRGADPNAVNLEGRTPLWFSCCGGHVATAELLLKRGGDPSVRKEGGSTALMAAAWTGHLPVARLILDYARDVRQVRRLLDEQNKDGCSSLWFAAGHGRAEMVAFLLSRGADFLQADCDGYTALHVARLRGYGDCALLLEETERGYHLAMARALYDDAAALASLPRSGTRARFARRRSSLTPAYLRDRAAQGLPFPQPVVDLPPEPPASPLSPASAAAAAAAAAGGAGGGALAADGEGSGAAPSAAGGRGGGSVVDDTVYFPPPAKTPCGGGRKRKKAGGSGGGSGGEEDEEEDEGSGGGVMTRAAKRGSGAAAAAAEAAARAAAEKEAAEEERRRKAVLRLVLAELKADIFVELVDRHFKCQDPALCPLEPTPPAAAAAAAAAAGGGAAVAAGGGGDGDAASTATAGTA